MFLRPTTQTTAARFAFAPIITRYICPAQHAMFARQTGWQLKLHLKIARIFRRHNIFIGTGNQTQRISLEALFILYARICVQIAQTEHKFAHMIGRQLNGDRNFRARWVRSDDNTFAILAAQLVRAWLLQFPVVAALATSAAVRTELYLYVEWLIYYMQYSID